MVRESHSGHTCANLTSWREVKLLNQECSFQQAQLTLLILHVVSQEQFESTCFEKGPACRGREHIYWTLPLLSFFGIMLSLQGNSADAQSLFKAR
jgi:hypothetical protein